MGKLITEADINALSPPARAVLEEDDAISPAAMDLALRKGVEVYQLKKVAYRELEALEEAAEQFKKDAAHKDAERLVITVVGKDATGIIAKLTAVCATFNVNILDISQTILGDVFAMIMIGDMRGAAQPFDAFKAEIDLRAEQLGLKVNVQRESLFNAMHRI